MSNDSLRKEDEDKILPINENIIMLSSILFVISIQFLFEIIFIKNFLLIKRKIGYFNFIAKQKQITKKKGKNKEMILIQKKQNRYYKVYKLEIE